MKEHILLFLNELEIQYRWMDHPAVFTVAELKNLPEDINPIKNLLLQEDDGSRKFLVVMDGNERLDLKAIRQKLDSKRLRFASSETLKQTLGVAPGAVSIFGLLHGGSIDVEVIVDEEIIKNGEELGFHPNDNTATIFIPSDKLIPILVKIGCKFTIIRLYDKIIT